MQIIPTRNLDSNISSIQKPRILNSETPGTSINLPVGNRLHAQPGINMPVYTPNLFFNPRVQLAMTDYNLYQITDTNTPKSKTRVLPIVDIASGLYFDRNAQIFKHPYQQTLEPQIYYTYIPIANQSSIPVFDTTVNTLTYDQIFKLQPLHRHRSYW